VKQRTGVTIDTAALDADDVAATTALIQAGASRSWWSIWPCPIRTSPSWTPAWRPA
jgi:hypothetical protein